MSMYLEVMGLRGIAGISHVFSANTPILAVDMKFWWEAYVNRQ